MQTDNRAIVDIERPHAGAGGDLPLFRAEAITERQTQWMGPVLLTPKTSHRVFAALGAGAAAAVVALLVFADYTSTARVNGWLVPHDGVVRVFAPRPGRVTRLHVAEGAQVQRGEYLLTLSDELQSAALGATQEQITRRLTARRASLLDEMRQQERLLLQQQAALRQRLVAIDAEQAQIGREIQLLQARVAIAERSEQLHREQRDLGFISEQGLQLVQAELIEQRARLGALERDRLALVRQRLTLEAELEDLPLKARREVAVLQRTVAQLEQEHAEVEARREIVVTAPQDGTVTAIQAVAGVNAATAVPLLSLVSVDAPLEAHLYGPTRSVGFVQPGQRVLLRYHAYPYQRFGHHEGVVTSVSRSAVSPAELPPTLSGLILTGAGAGAAPEPIYRITVRLVSQTVNAYGKPLALRPGMSLEANVTLESRRLFEWVLDPLYTLRGKWQG